MGFFPNETRREFMPSLDAGFIGLNDGGALKKSTGDLVLIQEAFGAVDDGND